ncbi:hypothetical protein HY642_06890 [Candidatus Woesearchaeota archaeon]|nr:hypothetical protein [Candidatus Woesearchaeota archaeon]
MPATLESRLQKLNSMSSYFAGDELYRIFSDHIASQYLPVIDKKFGVKHAIYEESGAGHTGSDTAALVIGIPVERKPGVWNALKYWFGERYRCAISVTFSPGRITCAPGYAEYARQVKDRYDETMRDAVGIELRCILH